MDIRDFQAQAGVVDHKVVRILRVLGKGDNVIVYRVVVWNGVNRASLDIRKFYRNSETEPFKPGKGISLDWDYAHVLSEVLPDAFQIMTDVNLKLKFHPEELDTLIKAQALLEVSGQN